MSDSSHFITIRNHEAIDISAIPVVSYVQFSTEALYLLSTESCHCASYFAFPVSQGLQFIMVIADDEAHHLRVSAHFLSADDPKELVSLTPRCFALHIFEREICENYGVHFINHPWLKPVRFPFNRHDRQRRVNDYPFYKIQSQELHEVGVGPVHAGVIEPGHFRFICNGEMVLHLEIQLGWQHRGIEPLMLEKKTLLQRSLLAENIAGDTAIGHSMAFAMLMESLVNAEVPEQLNIERSIALELERMAIHTGDISALCVDVAYSLGANIFGILRTGLINFMQSWCGNRLGKGLIRVGGTHATLNAELREKLSQLLDVYEARFTEMAHVTFRLPSVQNRFDFVGRISAEQARLIGAVGPAARMTGLLRDVRSSHPFAGFERFPIATDVREKGDVFARFLLKRKEIRYSIEWIRKVLKEYPFMDSSLPVPARDAFPGRNLFCASVTEGWRGEICHCAVTGADGELLHYKIKDPSMHNWKALELSLRDLEISDFPINNKSYNLSYCGHDL